ncbi:MAG: hypothetical protein ACJ8FY_16520 [Gemmataceae bacterium]
MTRRARDQTSTSGVGWDEKRKTIVKADYRVTIVIDGLSAVSRQRITRDLRRLKIIYDKVVGGREQSSALLRLADALAGLDA